MAGKNKLSLVKEDAQDIAARFSELLKRTHKDTPKPADVEELRCLLAENPEAELWKRANGVMGAAQEILLTEAGVGAALPVVWRAPGRLAEGTGRGFALAP
ncbi:MAG TPA: hypothetical protein VGV38_12865 [Pyrinomonadaceae bacterium]|nr:hypothetical protein [Pyrinomonadaceae bacterium]